MSTYTNHIFFCHLLVIFEKDHSLYVSRDGRVLMLLFFLGLPGALPTNLTGTVECELGLWDKWQGFWGWWRWCMETCGVVSIDPWAYRMGFIFSGMGRLWTFISHRDQSLDVGCRLWVGNQSLHSKCMPSMAGGCEWTQVDVARPILPLQRRILRYTCPLTAWIPAVPQHTG